MPGRRSVTLHDVSVETVDLYPKVNKYSYMEQSYGCKNRSIRQIVLSVCVAFIRTHCPHTATQVFV